MDRSSCPKNCTQLPSSARRIIQLRGYPCADPRPAVVMKRAKRAKFATSRAEEYWRYARQCLEIAPTFQDKEARATVLGFARAWLRLAYLAQANRHIAELTVQVARRVQSLRTRLTRARAQRWRSRCLMRSKEAFAYSRSTGCFCSVAASTVRVKSIPRISD